MGMQNWNAKLKPFRRLLIIGRRTAKDLLKVGKLWLVECHRCFLLSQCLIYSNRYKIQEKRSGYKTTMVLTISNISLYDYGNYKCVASNSLGQSDDSIRLYGNSLSCAHRRLLYLFPFSLFRDKNSYYNRSGFNNQRVFANRYVKI